MAGPDFIILGAMKSGTSTLAAQLALQTGVFMTTPKEPNYFSNDDVFARGPDWYADLFAGAAPDDLKGEASTHYTKLPTYPQTVARMTQALQTPRLIYMIRNPVERAVSHYIHEWTEGRAGRDMRAAFDKDTIFTDYGRYAHQIRPFIDAFGQDSVFLTSLEQIKRDGPGEFRRICDFLGLPDTAAWQTTLPPQNVSSERVRAFPLSGLLIDNPVMQTLRRTLVPKSVRTWVRGLRSIKERPELRDDLRDDLEQAFLRDRADLAALFPGHPALNLCYPFAEKQHPDITAVAIGRNEGQRLIDCLDALQDQVGRIIYVDSGSTDGSLDAARSRGADVIELDLSVPFTAARARNAGVDAMGADATGYVQFLDGDCILQPNWLGTAKDFLDAHPKVAVACGRRRERFPEATVYNRLIDDEWDTPVGQTKACGGDALMRVDALAQVGGFNPNLIAGEEPELCVRLRAADWKIWRLDAEMTLHDAAITRFGQWWQRAKRAGHACAEAYALHGQPPERHGWHNFKRIIGWGMVVPLVTLIGLTLSPWGAVLLLIYPAQMLRRILRGDPLRDAVFITLAKLPEAQGALSFLWRRIRGHQAQLIEYK